MTFQVGRCCSLLELNYVKMVQIELILRTHLTALSTISVSRLFFQYLATCNDHNLGNCIKMATVGQQLFQILNKPSKKCQSLSQIWPLGPKFVKSGHTDCTISNSVLKAN